MILKQRSQGHKEDSSIRHQLCYYITSIASMRLMLKCILPSTLLTTSDLSTRSSLFIASSVEGAWHDAI
uniref:Uncharacterized protein n=1 Tax=Solanum lycopersicum TaxID=4081 RepID=A0A3Q7I6Y3_SOLLC